MHSCQCEISGHASRQCAYGRVPGLPARTFWYSCQKAPPVPLAREPWTSPTIRSAFIARPYQSTVAASPSANPVSGLHPRSRSIFPPLGGVEAKPVKDRLTISRFVISFSGLPSVKCSRSAASSP